MEKNEWYPIPSIYEQYRDKKSLLYIVDAVHIKSAMHRPYLSVLIPTVV